MAGDIESVVRCEWDRENWLVLGRLLIKYYLMPSKITLCCILTNYVYKIITKLFGAQVCIKTLELVSLAIFPLKVIYLYMLFILKMIRTAKTCESPRRLKNMATE